MCRASLPHSSRWNTGKVIEPYKAKLRRRDFINKSDERSNLSPSLFPSLYTSAKICSTPSRSRLRSCTADCFRTGQSFGGTSFSAALKALAHDSKSPFGQFCAYQVIQRCTAEVCLGKQLGPLSIPCQGTRLSQALPIPPGSFVALLGRTGSQQCSALFRPTLRLSLM